MISPMIYREKSRRREIVSHARARRSSASSSVESFVKLYGGGTRVPVRKSPSPSSNSVASGRSSPLQTSLSLNSLFATFDGSQRRSSMEKSASSSLIVRQEGSSSRASLKVSLRKACILASAPLELPPPMLHGSGVPRRRNLWKRRGSVAPEPEKSRLGRSPFGRSLSQMEIDKMVSMENSKPEANNDSSNVTTVCSARSSSPGPSRAEVEEIIDRESRNSDEYTTLSTLIKFQRSSSAVSEPPVVKDTIVEKAAAVYLRASFSRNSRTEDCSSGFWNSVCRIVNAWIPASSCLGWSDDEIPDPGYY